MIFSVSSDSIERFLKFGPDSATLTVNDLVQELTISSQETLLAAWRFFLSQRQDFATNHPYLARVPIPPNQEGTMDMRHKMLSSVGAQDMDTSGYQLSHLDDVEFYCENDQLAVHAVFRPGIDTTFYPSAFNIFEMG